ncbi:hypothetical protein [Oceanobacillus kapialis]|uniref:hypothetical protein n=1 Tax=Oceanobacillus kapialis TaxID=481353 RepID=UPI0038511A04
MKQGNKFVAFSPCSLCSKYNEKWIQERQFGGFAGMDLDVVDLMLGIDVSPL